MPRFLNKVTLTGADLYTSYTGMARLTAMYPFVEWGILLSESRMGQDNRYPPLGWITDLAEGRHFDGHLAGHLCGRWARDLIAGGHEYEKFAHENDIAGLFGRIQLNISHLFNKMGRDDLEKLNLALKAPAWSHVRFIIQVRSYDLPESWKDRHDLDFLFDCSGGRGVLPEYWPGAIQHCGYAGGLTPENLAGQLPLIAEASNGSGVWIDAESGLRTSEVFDTVKAEDFLATAQQYVIDGTEDAAVGQAT
jgi:hypothetical protein